MSKSQKLIIAITGEICAGKDTMADYIASELNHSKRKASVVRSSDVLREIFTLLDIDPTRLDFHNITLFLRKNFGEDILARIIQRRVLQTRNEIVIWVGLRSAFDLEVLGAFTNKVLIYLIAPIKERHERLCKRTENSDDQEKTWDQFLEDSERSTEKTIRTFQKKADLVVHNLNNRLDDSQKSIMDFLRDCL